MQFLSMLQAIRDILILDQGYQIGLDWLGHFARIIIEGIGITGLGIIVFNLVLKAITLPFDIYQRVMSRKQNLIMREMQPELEKLQKQYADDKDMYNQKMMELQKKNGYSLLGACLPMIVSLVILIVAWQGFRAYAEYANLNYFVQMSESYNAAVLEHGVNGNDFFMTDRDGVLQFTRMDAEGKEETVTVTWENGKALPVQGDTEYIMTEVQDGDALKKCLTVRSTDVNKYIIYQYNLETSSVNREYKIDLDRFAAEIKNHAGEENEITKRAVEVAGTYVAGNTASEEELAGAAAEYIKLIGSTAAAERFRADDPGFLWIKNVWYPDVSYDHPIPDWEGFESEFRSAKVVTADGEEKPVTAVLTQNKYEALTASLTEEKEAANGYFILIVLSIGFMLLSQIIAMKSNKEANKYQTVDGQGASTQKMMLIIMPLIYAFFSFSYSAAFSIYMTMSSVVTILVTLLCNLILGRVFKKKEEKKFAEEHTRKLPWMK